MFLPRQDDGTISIEDFSEWLMSRTFTNVIDVIFISELKEEYLEAMEITPDDLMKYYYPIENENIVYINNSLNIINSIDKPVEDYN